MDKKDIDKLVDALVKATQAMEKCISILIGALPAKDDFNAIQKGDKDV